jgi:hypothetical protein
LAQEVQYRDELQEKERGLEAVASGNKEERDLEDKRQGMEAEHPLSNQGILLKAVGLIDVEGLIAS